MAWNITPGERTWTFKASVLATNTGCTVPQARALKLSQTIEITDVDVATAFGTSGMATVTEQIAEP
jgi:hypothetical protein